MNPAISVDRDQTGFKTLNFSLSLLRAIKFIFSGFVLHKNSKVLKSVINTFSSLYYEFLDRKAQNDKEEHR